MGSERYDVLVITSLLDELNALLEAGGGRAAWKDEKDPQGLQYHCREVVREDGRPLHIAAAWALRTGEPGAATRASTLIHHLDPTHLALSGVCSGCSDEVTPGDVVVADRIYNAHGRSLSASKDAEETAEGEPSHGHDPGAYLLHDTWRMAASYFACDAGWSAELVKRRPPSLESQRRWLLSTLLDHQEDNTPAPHLHPERRERCPKWSSLVEALRKEGLLEDKPGVLELTPRGRDLAIDERIKHPDGPPADPPFRVHVGALAGGSSAGAIEPRTLGIETDAAALGALARSFGRRMIVVRGVANRGGERDEALQSFAARASAEFLLAFLRWHVEPAAIGPNAPAARSGDGHTHQHHDEAGVSLPPNSDGQGNLLERVLRVCRLREEARGRKVAIARKPGPAPFTEIAEVSFAEPSGESRTYALAAVAQGASRQILDPFRADVHARFRKDDPGAISVLVHGGPRAPEELTREARAAGIHLVSFLEYQGGLIDFRPYIERQTHRLEVDPVYPPSLYVPQRILFTIGQEERAEEDALGTIMEECIASPYSRFVLVLGDFGIGKTFLLHELARRLGAEGDRLVPVLVEMRALEKAQKFDALIAHHLALSGMDRIDLRAFEYMLSEGRIVLLFDGFDELALRVSYDRAAEHLDTLMQASHGNAKVVVTSRTQHFFSDRQVKTALAERAASIPGYRLAKLQPFAEPQIRRFLVNRLGDRGAAETRLRMLDDVKDLLGLSENPRMLSFIADIPEAELRAAREGGEALTSAGLYQLLLTRWLVHEYERAHPPGTQQGLTVEQRWEAVTRLALLLWPGNERHIKMRELPADLIAAVQALGAHEVDRDVVVHQVGAGTLLVRDEEGNFSFIHRSVLEWLVARSAAEALKRGVTPAEHDVREISQLLADFFIALAGREEAKRWALGALEGGASPITRKNADLVLDRLGIKTRPPVAFTGQSLRGKDFSGKDLHNANFAEADLTDARLVKTNLMGATLERATLARADLSGAHLGHADLRFADLSFARLLGADLRGAKLGGAKLVATKLVGAKLDEGALKGCDVSAAALPVPASVEAMTAAASPCMALAYSPDGALLATAHEDGSVRLWDPVAGHARRVLAGHGATVRSVAFSPDGVSLASGSDDGTMRLWDAQSGRTRRVLTGQRAAVRSVAWSPTSETLATGSDDGTVRLFDARSGAPQRVLTGHERGVQSVAWSPDGGVLASGSMDGTVRLWNAHTGAAQKVLAGHEDWIQSVAWSPDGCTLASGSEDRTVRLWDARTGAPWQVFSGHEDIVRSVAWSPDGATLASGSNDRTVRLWDVRAGTARQVLAAHRAVRSVAFSPDGATLAGGSEDRTVRLWDVRTGGPRRVLTGHDAWAVSLAFDPDGATLASGSHTGSVRLWDSRAGTPRYVLASHEGVVKSVAWSPEGGMLASGSSDRTARLWDARTGEARGVLSGHTEGVQSVAWSPDGTALASGSDDRTVRLWDVWTGALRRTLTGHGDRVVSVAWSPNGSMLASGSLDWTVRLWYAKGGGVQRTLGGHEGGLQCVAFSPDGATLASCSLDRTVRLWEARTGLLRRAFPGHDASVRSLAWNPDGSMLASGSDDRTVRLWEARSGSPRRVLAGHGGRVVSVAWSPDGLMLASASMDGTMRLWDPVTGACLSVLLPLPEGWVAFTLDGRYKLGGDTAGAFWHAIGLCRFEPGELDPYLPAPLRIEDAEPLFPPSMLDEMPVRSGKRPAL